MPTVNLRQTDASISLDEYVEFVAANVDVTDSDSILESADKLQLLGNNRDFLIDIINEDFKDLYKHPRPNPYAAPTIVIRMGKDFMVRANIWPLQSGNTRKNKFEEGIFVYGMPHDHNYDFLTVGYHGSGYRTVIYDYDYDSVKGYIGENVDLNFLEDTNLNQGKVMFYRKSRDIHNQYAPKELSVSLNLLTATREGEAKSQYIFDLEKKTIAGYTQLNMAPRVFLMDLAKILGNENTTDILTEIAKTNGCPRTRAFSYSTVLEMIPHQANLVTDMATQDKHKLVRTQHGRELLMKGI